MIDWTKPLRTVKEHHPCKVLATDLKGNYPIAVLIPYGDEEIVYRYLMGALDMEKEFRKEVVNENQ